MIRQIAVLSLAVLLISACGHKNNPPATNTTQQQTTNTADANKKPVVNADPTAYGLPFKPNVPAESEIKADSSLMPAIMCLDYYKDMSKYMTIMVQRPWNSNAEAQKNYKLRDLKESKKFQKVIKEDSDGFVYEFKLDENMIDYDFYHVFISGEKMYEFNGTGAGKTAAEATELYEKIKKH